MTPEQVRAKQKLIGAYKQVISGMDAIKAHSCILLGTEKSVIEGLDRIEALQEEYGETLSFLEGVPDSSEIFILGPTVRVDLRELPPEGPGITDPEWPDCDTE